MRLLVILAVGMLLVSTAHAREGRVMKVSYHQDKVVNVVGNYRYATIIEFAKDEVVQGAVLGDSDAWEASPAKNMLFLKPILEDAGTNMTVMTNKRTYMFDLSARASREGSSSDAVYRIKFTYPGEDQQKLEALFVNADPNRAVSPDKLNFNYTYSGASALKPKRVFDDGEFTYIQFDKNTDYPAIFVVNKKGKESLVNFAVRGNYLVIPSVATRYSFRNGDEMACLFNEPLFSKWEGQKK